MDLYARWQKIEERFRTLVRSLLPGRAYRNIEEYLDACEFGLTLPDDTIPPRPADALRASGITPISPQEFLRSHPDWPQLADGERVTKPMAKMLYEATGVSAQFWLNLQQTYDEDQRHHS